MPSVRTVKKPNERRQEIVSASRALFLKKSYEKTTLQDVMKKLNIAKGTTYHYFKSKEELLEAVVQDICDDLMREVEAAFKAAKGNALKRLQLIVKAGRVAGREGKMLEQLHHSGNMAMHTRLLALTILRLAPLYAALIEQGIKERLFQTKQPLECAEFVLAGIQFLTDTGCYPWNQKDLRRRAAAFPALIEALLQAPKGSFDFLLQ